MTETPQTPQTTPETSDEAATPQAGTGSLKDQYDEKTRQAQDAADAATQKVNSGVQSLWGSIQKVFDASRR
ncbi:hypothetical protein [Roseospira goensis]|uniref:Uncharacterized protein n=1 Tax=Roseospira goensis TaxID=391922 RepID=A0A7W6RYP4_9PROT|nr:hypothetical protein [Roseospira goensis]MBB4285160.1 hypothetical protein [Roseospira goensis]